MIFLLGSLAFAEPQYVKMKEGDTALFDGRLLNDEAIATMLSQCEFNVDQCEIQNDLNCSIKVADKQYEYDVLRAEHDALEIKHKDLIEIKDEEIEILRRQSKPQMSMWAFFGGFIVGTGSSLATYYAVNKISETN